MSGYVYAYRRAWTHRACRDLLDGAIWNYLYQNAAWQDTIVYERGVAVPLKRGQIFVKFRALAAGFKCSEAKIRGCTGRIAKEAMIVAEMSHLGCVITICNYEQYQSPPDDDVAQTERPMSRKRSTDRSAANNDEVNQGNQSTPYSPEFEGFWDAFPRQRRGNKDKAWRAWSRVVKVVVPATIIAGVRAYAASDEVARGFAKGAEAWLNNDGWANRYQGIEQEAAFVNGVRPSWG